MFSSSAPESYLFVCGKHMLGHRMTHDGSMRICWKHGVLGGGAQRRVLSVDIFNERKTREGG